MEDQEKLSYIPTTSEIPQRYIELWDRHNERPIKQEIWDEVIEFAKEEERTHKANRGAYGDIPLEDLIDLGNRVRQVPDSSKRYEMVTEIGPNGKMWFDILLGFSSQDSIGAIAKLINRAQPFWKNTTALEIGTGTGNLTMKISRAFKRLISIDQARFMLEIARNRKGIFANSIQGEATRLPLKDESFGLAVSTGLTQSLTRSGLYQFAGDLYRILEPGGQYLDSVLYHPSERELHISTRKSLANAKGILADMIVDEVSGSARKTEPPVSMQKFVNIFESSGFHFFPQQDRGRSILMLEFTKVPPGYSPGRIKNIITTV